MTLKLNQPNYKLKSLSLKNNCTLTKKGTEASKQLNCHHSLPSSMYTKKNKPSPKNNRLTIMPMMLNHIDNWTLLSLIRSLSVLSKLRATQYLYLFKFLLSPIVKCRFKVHFLVLVLVLFWLEALSIIIGVQMGHRSNRPSCQYR